MSIKKESNVDDEEREERMRGMAGVLWRFYYWITYLNELFRILQPRL
jgi:hypothetical protein